MSLSTIARRLCCSRQSSTSRLSEVSARLYSTTEPTKDTGAGAGAAKSEEKKTEKVVFYVKLEKFEVAKKIKIIKEIRTIFYLGLKETKELVEKAPVVLKQPLTKDKAEALIAKIKAAGGVAVME